MSNIFKRIYLNFEDIENETFMPKERTLYSINWDGVNFDFLINYIPASEKAVVFGTGAIHPGRKKEDLPVFSRYTYSSALPYTSIFYFDSSIYMYEENTDELNINLAWGYGNENRFVLENIAYLLHFILNKLGVDQKNTLFYGSSGGGYTSILLATMFRSKANVINPQLFLMNHYKGSPLIKHFDSLIESRSSVVKFFLREGYIPDCTIRINTTSKNDMQLQLSPFIKEMSREGLEFGENVKIIFYNMDGGHNSMIPKESEINTIKKSMEKELIVSECNKHIYKIKPFIERVEEGYTPYINSNDEIELI